MVPCRAEKVEVATIYETFKLKVGLSDFFLGYHWNPPLFQMTRCRLQSSKAFPLSLLHYSTLVLRPADLLWRTVLGICRVCAAVIGKLDIGEPYIVFTVVHEDIVRYDICTVRFSDIQEQVDVNLLPVWT